MLPCLHRFIPSRSTKLDDSIADLDFEKDALAIGGWKDFCEYADVPLFRGLFTYFLGKLRLAIERNWNGAGPSEMKTLDALGDQVFRRKPIPNSEYTIVASHLCGIAVLDPFQTVCAMPPDYLQEAAFFAYDRGYLAFLRPIENLVEIWRDVATPDDKHKPTQGQKIAAAASAALYGPPDVGHFIPNYTLLTHIMDVVSGIEVSDNFVLVFDTEQVRLFSRHDGNFLFHVSKLTTFLPTEPAAVQLLPPRHGDTSAQYHEAALHQQSLFRKRRTWHYPRGTFDKVGLSSCGTTLVIVTGNNRILIAHDLQRLMTGDLPALNTVVEVKLAEEYGDPSPGSLAVTRDRIAISTYFGIVVFTLDRSNTGPGPVPLCAGFEPSSPVQISACFVRLHWRSQDSNLHISGTKLSFDAEPNAALNERVRRRPRRWRPPPAPAAQGAQPSQEDDAPSDDGADDEDSDGDSDDDSMPDLHSVSSSEGGEDEDEQSDDGVEPPSNPNPVDGDPEPESPQDEDAPGPGHIGHNPVHALFNAGVAWAQIPALPPHFGGGPGVMPAVDALPVDSAFEIDMAPAGEEEDGDEA
ncbi:hypothetical protein B0H17DRAFT_1050961 [Mycena rosella]|uniref:Uncharacterized protein n=1 Tax=Mycena rosella TaxID=1033263 RepID=A0AAD7DRD7_MYCRO|nr:hypothetical protein B0H17DRAFT_1050961 [Mycena rosella]